VRASSRDPDLVKEADVPPDVLIEVDGYSQSLYRHHFGLDDWAGRNINFAIKCEDSTHDIGNLIVIENANVPVAVELACGVSVVICRMHSLPHPLLASPVADHLPLTTWDQIKCGNALEASIALAREGLRPVSRGRGRIFREYLRALYELYMRADLSLD